MGFKRVVGIRDRQVLCPTIDWVKKFARGLSFRLSGDEEDDCDDAARDCVSAANKARRKNRTTPHSGHAVLFCTLATSLGFALNGIDSSGSSHATNIIRTAHSWVFLEPQTRQLSFVADVLGDLALLDPVLVQFTSTDAMNDDMQNGNIGLETAVAKHESDIAALTRDVGSLSHAVRDLSSVVRSQGERTESQIQQLMVAVTSASGPRKTDWHLVLGSVGLILAIGAAVFSPLQWQLSDNKARIETIDRTIREHQQLQLHPVGLQRIDSLEKAFSERVAKRDEQVGKIIDQLAMGNLAVIDLKQRLAILEEKFKVRP